MQCGKLYRGTTQKGSQLRFQMYLACCVLFVCMLHSVPCAQKAGSEVSQYEREIKQKANTLDSIKNALKKGREKLTELEQQEGDVRVRIEQIEKNIHSSKTYLGLLTSRIDSIELNIQKLKDSLVIEQRKLQERQSIMEHRLRQAYMTGTPNVIMMLFSSSSPTDFVNKTKYVQELKRYDDELLKSIDKTRESIDGKRAQFQDERDQYVMLSSTKKQEHATLLKEEDQRKAMLDDVRSKKKAYEKMVTELEKSQQELNAFIKMLEAKRKKAKQQVESKKGVLAFDKRKGRLPWPVTGTVTQKFGKLVHPVYQTVTMNNGIDIRTKSGSSVQSVASGTVIHTGSMRGLGKLVIVEHAGGYITVYAHLGEISVKLDQPVENGAVLGKVSAPASGDSSLHFELRKSSEALDPSEWLE